MRRRSKLLMLLASAPISFSAPARTEAIKAIIADPAGLAAPGCAVGIFRRGKLAEFTTAGAADIATRRAMNANTLFYAASVSKQFTTLAVMQLVLKGKIGLDDDIRKWLPELPQYARPITVAMLIHHTSGVRDSLELLYLEGKTDFSAVSRAEGLAVTLRQSETKFEPGTQYDYSNGGYLLLSEVVERAAGEPFADYVNRHVLKPMGMTRSFIMAGARTADANFAHGYNRVAGKDLLADNYPLFGGSGGLMTTINDLARYDHDIDSGHKVWTPEIAKLMLEPGRFNDGSVVRRTGQADQTYASGIMVGPHWFSHSGGATGFKTMFARLPERRIGAAMLCNRGEVSPYDRINAIVAALGEGLPPVTQSQPVASLDGQYRSKDLDVIYQVAVQGDQLKLSILPAADAAPRKVILLKPVDGGGYGDGTTSLVPDADGAGFAFRISRITLHFTRM